jgi:multidrug resistance efflux pump
MSIFSYVRKHSFLAGVTFVLLVFLAIFIGTNSGKEDASLKANDLIKKVTVANVQQFKNGDDFVFANGTVVSRGQADLKSQVSAPVKTIYRSIGDTIYAGDIILELENSDIRASLAQAKASLSLVYGQDQSAKSNAVDRVRDSYIKAYEAVITNIDPILFNNDGNYGRFTSNVVDYKLSSNIITTRIDLYDIFRKWEKLGIGLSEKSDNEEIVSAIKIAQKNLAVVDKLLGYMSEAINNSALHASGLFLTSINSWKVIVSTSRASINNTSTSLINVLSTLSSVKDSDEQSSSASVVVASSGVRALEVQLAKTIIRSPINGKVAGLPLGVGELASPGQLLATVVGGQGLEIRAYASGEDINRIKVGSQVKIGNFAGFVESVAPSVSITNRKVEVKIAVTDESTATTSTEKLVIGQNVSVLIKADKDISKVSKDIVYKLPIQNVKIVPGDAYVFTVEDSKIKKNQVILGEVEGEFIEIVGGLSDNMNIVTPVYELDEGEEVVVE